MSSSCEQKPAWSVSRVACTRSERLSKADSGKEDAAGLQRLLQFRATVTARLEACETARLALHQDVVLALQDLEIPPSTKACMIVSQLSLPPDAPAPVWGQSPPKSEAVPSRRTSTSDDRRPSCGSSVEGKGPLHTALLREQLDWLTQVVTAAADIHHTMETLALPPVAAASQPQELARAYSVATSYAPSNSRSDDPNGEGSTRNVQPWDEAVLRRARDAEARLLKQNRFRRVAQVLAANLVLYVCIYFVEWYSLRQRFEDQVIEHYANTTYYPEYPSVPTALALVMAVRILLFLIILSAVIVCLWNNVDLKLLRIILSRPPVVVLNVQLLLYVVLSLIALSERVRVYQLFWMPAVYFVLNQLIYVAAFFVLILTDAMEITNKLLRRCCFMLAAIVTAYNALLRVTIRHWDEERPIPLLSSALVREMTVQRGLGTVDFSLLTLMVSNLFVTFLHPEVVCFVPLRHTRAELQLLRLKQTMIHGSISSSIQAIRRSVTTKTMVLPTLSSYRAKEAEQEGDDAVEGAPDNIEVEVEVRDPQASSSPPRAPPPSTPLSSPLPTTPPPFLSTSQMDIPPLRAEQLPLSPKIFRESSSTQ